MTGSTVVFLLIVLVVIGFSLATSRAKRRTFSESCSRAAKKLGGEFVGGGWLSSSMIRFSAHGRTAFLEFRDGADDGRASTRATVSMRGRSPGTFRLIEEGLGQIEFAEYLLDLAPTAGIHWMESTTSGVGLCQVCGTEMRERVVHCARCRTPHHEECWTYVGECSTFACRGRRYLR